MRSIILCKSSERPTLIMRRPFHEGISPESLLFAHDFLNRSPDILLCEVMLICEYCRITAFMAVDRQV